MSVIQYASNNPYANTPEYSWRIGRYVYRPIPPNANDLTITLQPQHQYRPDKLSYDLYGSPVYWWVFCVRNAFLRSDPVWNFLTGLTIIAPSLTYLQQVLGG